MKSTFFLKLLIGLLLSINGISKQIITENKLEINREINSSILNEKRSFTIHLPSGYYEDSKNKYPVLYVLDGENLKEHIVFIHDFLSKKGHIPEMIIVSIPHTGRRSRDYSTYFRDTDKVNVGADNFLNFIEKEVISSVEKEFRTSNYRLLSGHSKSGLFVIHSLIKRPELFKARFAFSPSCHYIPKQIDLLKDFLENKEELPGYFYMNVGGAEFYKIKDAFQSIKKQFSENAPKGLRFDFDLSEVDGHQTTAFIGQHLAFKKLYAPLKLNFEYENMTYQQVVEHFISLSIEFGYEVKPREKEILSMGSYYINYQPSLEVFQKLVRINKTYYPESEKIKKGNILFYENWLKYGASKKVNYKVEEKPDVSILNSFGYRYLNQNKFDEAFYLFNLAVKLYPEASNPYDSLGEAYEKSGNLKKALKMFEKAKQTAIQNEEEDKRVSFFSKNVERLKLSISNK